MYFKAAVLSSLMFLFGCMTAIEQVNAQEKDRDLLYRAKCTACHRSYPPRNYTYQKFQTYITRYGSGLNSDERRRLKEYLKANAKQEEDVKMDND